MIAQSVIMRRLMMTINTKTVDETLKLGRNIGTILTLGSLVSLRGPLGAGKTVIAKGIAEALGIKEAIVSPTFTLVQEYEGREKLYHLDIYRLSGEDEFESMGGEEFLYPDGITLIEWSEKIDSMLPDDTIFIDITINDDLSRTINIKGLDEYEHSLC